MKSTRGSETSDSLLVDKTDALSSHLVVRGCLLSLVVGLAMSFSQPGCGYIAGNRVSSQTDLQGGLSKTAHNASLLRNCAPFFACQCTHSQAALLTNGSEEKGCAKEAEACR